jgi:hypothetical protein
MNEEINELIDRLSAKERADLLDGLRQRDRKRAASDALTLASLITHHFRTLGMHEEAEYMANLQHRLYDLT